MPPRRSALAVAVATAADRPEQVRSGAGARRRLRVLGLCGQRRFGRSTIVGTGTVRAGCRHDRTGRSSAVPGVVRRRAVAGR